LRIIVYGLSERTLAKERWGGGDHSLHLLESEKGGTSWYAIEVPWGGSINKG